MAGMDLAEDQIKVLEENFTKVSKHPDDATLMLVAAECGLSEEETAVSLSRDPHLQRYLKTRRNKQNALKTRHVDWPFGSVAVCRFFLIGQMGALAFCFVAFNAQNLSIFFIILIQYFLYFNVEILYFNVVL